MKFSRIFFLVSALSFTIIGCSNEEQRTTGSTETTETMDSIDAEEVIRLDSAADIFQYDGVIYKTNIDWVENLSLTKGSQIGEIKTRNKNATNFKNEESNIIPVGTKIFKAKERGDILVVEIDGELRKYLAIVEG
ncbi:hypothetical protein ACFPYN_13565 [Paenisporosarcina macmurdoensis]|uniref:Lipoprotein n=1 Tax=Paenisporosarcina macmurdoensis TaxID=212659 RepID=A0ABW1L8X5_9BACL